MLSPKVGSALVVTTALLLSAQSRAGDSVPSLDLRGFNPSGDPNSGLYFEPAASPATLDWNAALWNNYSYRPVTLRSPVDDEVAFEVVSHRISGDFVANFGLFERLAIGVDVPFLLYQTGDDVTADAQAVLGDYSLPGQALGDMKVLVKGTIIKPTNGEFGGFALAIHERLGLPTGEEASYLGEGAVQSETRLLVEYRYLALAVYGAVGVKFRGEDEQIGCNALPLDADCPTVFGDELPWGLSMAFRPQAIGLDDAGHWTWFVESFGYVPMTPESPFSNAAVSQAQLGGGARFTFKNDISVVAAVDAAMVGGIGNPPVRATLALSWAPRKHDMDDDGVRDEVDLCPEDLKEDIDGFEDNDGCPDWDNDDDGVPDDSDRCDGEEEDEDGYQDDDGCADPDNDSDNILDIDDSCPDVPGIASSDPTQRGCPDRDSDKDGVEGDKDRCPQEKEDPDGFEDDDGCLDPDNDGDGVNDDEDSCRDVKGVMYPNSPADNGCPDGDEDGITDGKDACPADKGVASEEAGKHGCPEGDDKDKDKDAKPKPGGR